MMSPHSVTLENVTLLPEILNRPTVQVPEALKPLKYPSLGKTAGLIDATSNAEGATVWPKAPAAKNIRQCAIART